jgi:hypothetical protein
MMKSSSITAGLFILIMMILLGVVLFGCAQVVHQPLAISLGAKISLSILIGIGGLSSAGLIFLAQANMPTGDGSPGAAVTILIVATALIALLCFFGCAQKTLVAPSGGAVQGGLSRVQSGANQAEIQRQEILTRNQETSSDLQRVDAKDAFLEGARKWKAMHPKPTPTP